MKFIRKLYLLLPVLIFVLFWQIISISSIVNSTLFPPPTKVFLSFIELLQSGELFIHIKSSLLRVIFGLVIGSFLNSVNIGS